MNQGAEEHNQFFVIFIIKMRVEISQQMMRGGWRAKMKNKQKKVQQCVHAIKRTQDDRRQISSGPCVIVINNLF